MDGDALTAEADGTLMSGPIEAPASWLAVVTALGPADYTPFPATVPLQGGTADVVVRAFADDPDWGEATLDLAVEALPILETRGRPAVSARRAARDHRGRAGRLLGIR